MENWTLLFRGSNSDSKGEFNGNVIVSVRDNGTKTLIRKYCRNYFPGLFTKSFSGVLD